MKLWAGKATECSKIAELLRGSAEDKNVERYTEDGGLDCEVPKGCLTLKESMVDIVYFELRICGPDQLGLTNQL